jgi:hypothetical protein
MMERIKVARVTDLPQLEAMLGKLALKAAERTMRLIILDSIAGIYRELLGQAGFNASERARGLLSLASVLKGLSHAHGVAVITVNQVSDVIGFDEALAAAQVCGPAAPNAARGREAVASALARQLCAVFSNGRWIRPALGVVWDACVTTRIMMTHPRDAAGVRSGPGWGAGAAEMRATAEMQATAPFGPAAGYPAAASVLAAPVADADDLRLDEIDWDAIDRESEEAALRRQDVAPAPALVLAPVLAPAPAPAPAPASVPALASLPSLPARRLAPRLMAILLSSECAPAVVPYAVTAVGIEATGAVEQLAVH